ncbi:MAG: 50S ribosomal protein L11 methyltransferase [Gammaproteobacteria bacterium]|nr:50S ribosomal protein L11 methyltransferase [Gammaproteobacteria bacterium]
MPWLQFNLTVDKSRAPLIELLFENLGAVAVTLGDAGDEPMLEPGPGETPLWQATRVTGLFEGSSDADALRDALNRALATDVSRNLVVETVADRDWERAWLDRFQPMRFGEHLWIRPSGHEVHADDAVIIDLDPGLAFGTGTHQTTALCLEWLDRHPPRDRSVIDFGSGSGILAIAALKLGARRAIAVDHDPQAVIASRDNAERNGVSERIAVLHSDEFDGEAADLVIANILANILLELAPLIGRLVRPGGELVMSGILVDQADDVIAAYADRFDFEPRSLRDDWVLLHARRR